ncbi:unnamed protein product [Paramecium pentaurelia]|uniref:Uncharacterized protein n=1 Tax=Paramecium pentaurelia TaxID=43138 RepID=A0A8S1SP04_9CILI|nr:unnamed protein product [Paramecium pentaurelia]
MNFSIRRFLKFLEKRKFKTSLDSFLRQIINTFMNLQSISKKIQRINLQDHKFNQEDYSSETYEMARYDLMKRMKENKRIIDFIKFLVLLPSIYIGSNALNFLVGMKVDISNQSFENIGIKNTSIIGGNLVRCNFNGSEFDNVDINGVNFNGAQLFNCQWKQIKINELNKLDGHSGRVLSVQISPDGNTLASGSGDNSILLWDVNSDKNYNQILAQFKAPLIQNNSLPESNQITILRIFQTPLFEAKGALILNGDFINDEGYDLRSLFKSKGSCYLDNQLKQKNKENCIIS